MRCKRLVHLVFPHVASVFAFAVLLSATVMGSDAPSSGRAAMMSPQFNPVVVGNGLVYAANTPGNSVDVFESDSGRLIRRISVGIEPVGLALRPDRTELWVANHMSDSVSVIDLQNSGNTRFQVVHTIHEIDPATRSTRFDDPVGIVFADNDKAYVSLSSENQIAVIDATTRKILRRLKIPAQEPRGMAVRNARLYVLAFESNNQTQLSGGKKEDIDGDLVTFDAWEHSIRNNNVLSIGHTIDIVKWTPPTAYTLLRRMPEMMSTEKLVLESTVWRNLKIVRFSIELRRLAGSGQKRQFPKLISNRCHRNIQRQIPHRQRPALFKSATTISISISRQPGQMRFPFWRRRPASVWDVAMWVQCPRA